MWAAAKAPAKGQVPAAGFAPIPVPAKASAKTPAKGQAPAAAQAEPAAAGGKVAVNFGKIKAGMTVEEVTKLLGEPTSTTGRSG